MKSELIKFKIHSSKFNDGNRWKIINITDDLSWIHANHDKTKINYYWFTGYSDVTKKEIFEGDIVKFRNNGINDIIGHIEYCRERNRNGFYIVTTGSIGYIALNEFFMQSADLLIIGNVIDHRHLIWKH